VSFAIAISAVVVAVSVAVRTIRPPSLAQSAEFGAEARAPYVDSWADAMDVGIRLYGREDAPVTIVEFTDLECPACRGFHEVLREVAISDSIQVQVIYVAFPLPMHRFAIPAARAMECADSLGSARQWAEAVYSSQDSLGLLSWGILAARAGVGDTTKISECALAPRQFRRIAGGTALGEAHNVTATPTIWINGWQFKGGLPRAKLDSVVANLAREAQR
jgi:protein-disulfide isomerase